MKTAFFHPKAHAFLEMTASWSSSGFFFAGTDLADDLFRLLELHSYSFDLILVDASSPDASKLIERLRERAELRDKPILVTSSSWTPTQFQAQKQSSWEPVRFIKFPFDEAQFKSAIADFFPSEAPTFVGTRPQLRSEPAPPTPTLNFTLEAKEPTQLSSISLPGLTKVGLAEPPPPPREVRPMLAPDAAPTHPSIQLTLPSEKTLARILPTFVNDSKTRENIEIPGGPNLTSIDMPSPTKTNTHVPPAPPSISAPSPALAAVPDEPAFVSPYHMPPVGDAVVPGGAARSPDVETLKKYLLLREQDVAALSSQLKSARSQLDPLMEAVSRERSRVVELEGRVEQFQAQVREFDREKEQALASQRLEIQELQFQIKAKNDKSRLLESRVKESVDELMSLKKRVRLDIQKIRTREKELENRLEMIRKDSEVIVALREAKIVELKRKLDVAEFNLDLVQDQYTAERETHQRLRDRLEKVGKAMKLAGGFLDDEDGGIKDAS